MNIVDATPQSVIQAAFATHLNPCNAWDIKYNQRVHLKPFMCTVFVLVTLVYQALTTEIHKLNYASETGQNYRHLLRINKTPPWR